MLSVSFFKSVGSITYVATFERVTKVLHYSDDDVTVFYENYDKEETKKEISKDSFDFFHVVEDID